MRRTYPALPLEAVAGTVARERASTFSSVCSNRRGELESAALGPVRHQAEQIPTPVLGASPHDEGAAISR
jgi:hypothetical protein